MKWKPPIWATCSLFAVAVALTVAKQVVPQESASPAATATGGEQPTAAATASADVPAISVAEARERARMLHDVYEATLRTIHLRYFKENTGVPIPSRAMEDVFARVSRRSKVKAHWIAVNSQAMTLDHEPKDEFEKAAARSLGSGAAEFERVEQRMYRRAAPILLLDSCLKCHAPPPIRVTNTRYAGLVLSMPVKSDSN